MSKLEPVSLALVQNRLDHIAKQMGWVMVRTSRSPIFNQSHDFSCFITDGAGTLISQADGIPIHTGGGGFAIRALLGVYGNDVAEGDIFLLNDPYVAGGNHLPDFVIACPIIVDGTLIAFTCNRAHQSDIGGGAAGTYNPEATEIFHEGIRLPPLKLVRKGVTDDGLWRLLMLNTRTPHLMDGDLRAMIGSARVGGEEVAKLARELGRENALAHFEGILSHADTTMRAHLAALPDGVYSAEERFDNDCFTPMNIPIRVTLTKSGDRLKVDFTGTHPQIKGFKNSSLANTYSGVFAGLASFFEADLPRNEGTFRAVEIIAPEGSLINAKPPAPLTMCTVFPAHEIMHVIWWALAKADPSRALAGWGKNSFPVNSGKNAAGRVWVMYHWGACSGAGAATTRDGFNQMGPMITLGGLTVPNAETFERLYPVAVQRHELSCDGGGAGRYRGGTGVHYEIDVETASELSFRSEGVTRETGLGVSGGRSGRIGRARMIVAGGEPQEPPQYGNMRVGPVRLELRSPGGGGVGDPLEREVARVVRDVRDELVSADVAEAIYGVVMAPCGTKADAARTAQRRSEMRSGATAPAGGDS